MHAHRSLRLATPLLLAGMLVLPDAAAVQPGTMMPDGEEGTSGNGKGQALGHAK